MTEVASAEEAMDSPPDESDESPTADYAVSAEGDEDSWDVDSMGE